MAAFDPYEILGLPSDATADDAAEAYRRRVGLAEEAKRVAPTADDRARIERQQLLIARAYEMIDARLEEPAPRTFITPSDRPPALKLSAAVGAAGLVFLVVGLLAGSTALYGVAVVLGAISLASALVWRHQLVEAWAARHPA